MKWFMVVAVTLAGGFAGLSCGDDDGNGQDSGATDSGVMVDTEGDSGVSDITEQDGVDDSGADEPEVTPLPTTEELLALGPYSVGFRTMDVTYRPEGYSEDRTLNNMIWYPSADTEGPAARYTYYQPAEGTFADAVPLEGDAYPLLVYSHGNGGLAEVGHIHGEFFATHGWMVVSINHTGNVFLDNPLGISFEADTLRPQDATASLDALEALDEGDALSGRFSDDVVMMGHSYGALTTMLVAGGTLDMTMMDGLCAIPDSTYDCDFYDATQRAVLSAGYLDARIDLAVLMAPGFPDFYGETGLEQIGVPVLLFTGGMDETLPNEENGDIFWQRLADNDAVRVDIPTAGHFTFSRTCTDAPGFLQGNGCGADNIPDSEAVPVINSYVRAFAGYHLWGEDVLGAVFDGTISLHDGFTVSSTEE